MVTVVASFSVGVFANQVIVQQVQSIAGNHRQVPAPELRIINTIWHINLTQSLVTDLILNVTTAGPTSTTGFKVYQVFAQVSCLDTAGVSVTCSTGSGQTALPTNMNGASAVLVVRLSPPIDPETMEIDDLSFIVTSSSLPSGPGVIGVVGPAMPTLNRNGLASVGVSLTSINGFSGSVTLHPAPLPPGVKVTSQNVTLQPGGTGTATLTIDASGAGQGPENFLIVIVASDDPCPNCLALFPVWVTQPILRPSCQQLGLSQGITITANTTQLGINFPSGIMVKTVKITVSSFCGFSGAVTLTATFTSVPLTQPPPSGHSVSLSAGSVTLTPGGSVAVTEMITINAATDPLGDYTITTTATSGSLSSSVDVTLTLFAIG